MNLLAALALIIALAAQQPPAPQVPVQRNKIPAKCWVQPVTPCLLSPIEV